MAVIAVDALSVLLFKVGVLIFGLILAFQLLGETGTVPFDFTEVFTLQQVVYAWILLMVTILAIIEARTMQNKAGGGLEGFTIGVLISYAIAIVGIGLTIFVFFAEDPTQFPPKGYEFSNGTVNELIAYFLLVGALLVFINARKQIFRVRVLFQ